MSEEEERLQEALGQCMLGSSWAVSMAAVAVAVPLGVRARSYKPLVYAALLGSMGDLLRGIFLSLPSSAALPLPSSPGCSPPTPMPAPAGYNKCQPQRQALKVCQQRAAITQPPTLM